MVTCTGSRIGRSDCASIAGFAREVGERRGGGGRGGGGSGGVGADGVDNIIVTGTRPGGVNFNDLGSLPGVLLDQIVVTARKLERWNQFGLVLGDPLDTIRAFGSVYAPMSDATGTEYQTFIGYFEGRPNALYRSPVRSGERSGGGVNSLAYRSDLRALGFVPILHAHTHFTGVNTTRGLADSFYGFSGGDVSTAWDWYDSSVTFYVVYTDRILSMTHAQAGEYYGYRFPGIRVD